MRWSLLVAVLLAVAASAPGAEGAKVVPHRMTAQAGATRAVLFYVPWPKDLLMRPRLEIVRRGSRFVQFVPRSARDRLGPDARTIPFTREGRPLVVRDLDGDGEPEVLLGLYWGGAHCCSWLRLYRFDPERNRYVPQNHWWGELKADYRLRDLDGDGRPELVAGDDRFMWLSYYSADPIQIWSYRQGRFRDVTRRFPKQVAQDARKWWRFYLEDRRKHDSARESLAAWAADQYLLGQASVVDRVLTKAASRGELRRHFFGPKSQHGYVVHLKTFLRKTGYAGGR